MTDLRIESDSHVLGPYLDEVASSVSVPERGLDELLAAVATTPQQQRGFLPSLLTWRFQSMFSATKFVVAGALLALFGGFLLAGPLAPEGEDALQAPGAATSATPDASDIATENDGPAPERQLGLHFLTDLPDGLRSGSIPAGDEVVRWVHLTSDLGPLPDEGHVLATADGIAVHDRQGGTLMATEDGVSWVEVPSPTAAWHGRVAHVGGAYWFIEPESGRLWRSSDLFDWHELEASVMRAAIPRGWKSRGMEVRGPVTVNGEVSFWIDYEYSLPGKALGITEHGATFLQQVAENRYWLCVDKKSCRAEEPTRDLAIKDSDAGLHVIDRASGKQLGILEDATYAGLYEGRIGTKGSSFAISGDTVTRSLHPRPALEIDFLLRKRPPEDLPDGALAVPLGSRWFASEEVGYGSEEAGERWIHAGGAWVSLADLELPESGPTLRDPMEASARGVAAPGKNGLADLALLWYEDSGVRHLWVVTVEPAA